MNKYVLKCIVCMGSRSVIVYIAKTTWPDDLYFVGIYYIFVATRFTYSYFLEGSNKCDLLVLKPLHAIVYLAFAYCAFHRLTNIAWKILLYDLCFGVVAIITKGVYDYKHSEPASTMIV